MTECMMTSALFFQMGRNPRLSAKPLRKGAWIARLFFLGASGLMICLIDSSLGSEKEDLIDQGPSHDLRNLSPEDENWQMAESCFRLGDLTCTISNLRLVSESANVTAQGRRAKRFLSWVLTLQGDVLQRNDSTRASLFYREALANTTAARDRVELLSSLLQIELISDNWQACSTFGKTLRTTEDWTAFVSPNSVSQMALCEFMEKRIKSAAEIILIVWSVAEKSGELVGPSWDWLIESIEVQCLDSPECEALRASRDAEAMFRGEDPATWNRSRECLEKRDFDCAIAELETVIQSASEARVIASAHRILANAYLQSGVGSTEEKERLRRLERAFELTPDHWQRTKIAILLIHALRLEGSWKKCVIIGEEVLSEVGDVLIRGDHAHEAMMSLAKCNVELDRLAAAEKWIEKAESYADALGMFLYSWSDKMISEIRSAKQTQE